ncbi:MAG TPA: hypothetical protein VMW43_06315 [Bacteroidota bacterium]|nr:hypothetical protein [Bacteroidota bacterium]
MKPYPQADLSRIRTIPIRRRKNKVRAAEFARVYEPKGGGFERFLASVPAILAGRELRDLVHDIVRARKRNKPCLVMIGAHVVKVGCAPLLIDLLERGVITGLAMNSAAAIHDVETALWGTTSEDVAANIADGSFGMARETGEFINGVLRRGETEDAIGYGEALGRALQKARRRRLSLLAVCYRLRVPVTVHAAIGTDIIHQQPSMDGGATGEMSFRDFRVLCREVAGLGNGGVVLNFGSAVILPEVFLKAVTVARNLGAPVRNFSSANFDMIQQYRSRLNVVERPTGNGGRGYLFTGHHELMIPLLAAMINSHRLRRA